MGLGTMPEPWAEGRRLIAVTAVSGNAPEAIATNIDRVESPAWVGDNEITFVSRDKLFEVDASGTTHVRLALGALTHEAYYGDSNTNDRYAWHG